MAATKKVIKAAPKSKISVAKKSTAKKVVTKKSTTSSTTKKSTSNKKTTIKKVLPKDPVKRELAKMPKSIKVHKVVVVQTKSNDIEPQVNEENNNANTTNEVELAAPINSNETIKQDVTPVVETNLTQTNNTPDTTQEKAFTVQENNPNQIEEQNNVPQQNATDPNNNENKKKKKKRVWLEVVTAIALFGTVLAGAGYHVYKLVTQEQKQEEYKREVVVKSSNATASGKQSGDNDFVISLYCTENEKRVKSVTIKIGDVDVPTDKYTFDISTQSITFKIDYLKTLEGTINITAVTEYIRTITLNKSSISLEAERDSFELIATLKHIEGTITWKSSDETIAKIEVDSADNTKCLVTALKKGNVSIIATIEDLRTSCSVTVREKLVEATYDYIGFDSSGKEIQDSEQLKNASYFEVKCSNSKECQRATIPATYTPTGASKPIPVEGIYDGAFYNQDGGNNTLLEVEFENPDNIKRIGHSAFSLCYGLKSFQELTKATSIGSLSFSGCYMLKEFIIPETVIYIGENAFTHDVVSEEVIGLESLIFKDQETSLWFLNKVAKSEVTQDIKGKTKEECAELVGKKYSEYTWEKDREVAAKLTYVGYDENDKKVDAGNEGEITHYKVYCDNDNDRKYVKKATILGKYNDKPVTGFDRISTANKWGFCNCVTLKEVTFENPENIVSFDYYCFRNCNSLNLDLSKFSNLKVIEGYAFYNCKSLSSQFTSNTLVRIENNAFCNCLNMKSFNSSIEGECVIPSNIESIGANCFCYETIVEEKLKIYPIFDKIIFKSSKINLNNCSFGEYKSDSKIFGIPTESGYSDWYYLKNGDDNNYFALCGYLNSTNIIDREPKIMDSCKVICESSLGSINIINSFVIPESVELICYDVLYYEAKFDSSVTADKLQFVGNKKWKITKKQGGIESVVETEYTPTTDNFEQTKKYLLHAYGENFKWVAVD